MAKIVTVWRLLIVIIIISTYSVRETQSIVNGTLVPFGQFKSVVNIMYNDWDNKTSYPLCTGNIINEFWIATACHCLGKVDKKLIFIIAGDNDRRKNDATEQTRFIEDFKCHPQYSRDSLLHDFALIKLWSKLIFHNVVQKVLIGLNGLINSEITIFTGWGFTSYDANKSSNQLMKFETKILDSSMCEVESLKTSDIECYLICATRHSNHSAACSADSGGGLFQIDSNKNLYLIGTLIANYDNENCSTNTHTALFTNLKLYNTWINNITYLKPAMNSLVSGNITGIIVSQKDGGYWWSVSMWIVIGLLIAVFFIACLYLGFIKVPCIQCFKCSNQSQQERLQAGDEQRDLP